MPTPPPNPPPTPPPVIVSNGAQPGQYGTPQDSQRLFGAGPTSYCDGVTIYPNAPTTGVCYDLAMGSYLPPDRHMQRPESPLDDTVVYQLSAPLRTVVHQLAASPGPTVADNAKSDDKEFDNVLQVLGGVVDRVAICTYISSVGGRQCFNNSLTGSTSCKSHHCPTCGGTKRSQMASCNGCNLRQGSVEAIEATNFSRSAGLSMNNASMTVNYGGTAAMMHAEGARHPFGASRTNSGASRTISESSTGTDRSSDGFLLATRTPSGGRRASLV